MASGVVCGVMRNSDGVLLDEVDEIEIESVWNQVWIVAEVVLEKCRLELGDVLDW